MHLLISLVVVAGAVLTAGHPQYQPPSSLQHHYRASPPSYSTILDAARPVQDQKPMYTYAEVNTPYYQYHYYSPVHQPPLLEASSPESSIRNEVNSYTHGAPTTLKHLFYPEATTVSLSSPKSNFRNDGYAPQYDRRIQPFPPKFENTQEVYITSKPLTVNNAVAPMFRTYQQPIFNTVDPPVTPASNLTKLLLGSSNILRERYGNDKSPENPLTSQPATLEPGGILPANANSNALFKPLVIPESLATPSSTIIKEEIKRRGISPQLSFRDQFSSPTKKPSLEKSLLSKDTFTTTSAPQFSNPLEKSHETFKSDAEIAQISANILRVFSSPNLGLTHNLGLNTSESVLTEKVLNDSSTDDVSRSPDSITQFTPEVTTQISTDTTLSHRQKITKKVKPTVVPKKFLPKHPNVLFYSPGHDIPN